MQPKNASSSPANGEAQRKWKLEVEREKEELSVTELIKQNNDMLRSIRVGMKMPKMELMLINERHLAEFKGSSSELLIVVWPRKVTNSPKYHVPLESILRKLRGRSGRIVTMYREDVLRLEDITTNAQGISVMVKKLDGEVGASTS
ncbi:hypothetical protein K7X08_036567 [Anisodus acutangulus]|uniref:Uncharacterized protein n=1 Tax=Anisodus acutangulus TaxID=402998 RepID=A0A9Q1L8J9_9SOLA|nr:hypothetical protein K7X08_036567 [Anisodus acutangulus]